MGDNQQSLTAEQISMYLAENNDFFIKNPQVIERLQLNVAPEGIISFSQKQTEQLQAKNKQLQQQLHDLIDNARQNMAVQNRINQLCLRVLDAASFDDLLMLLMTDFKQEFSADEIALHLFSSHNDTLILPQTDKNISVHHSEELHDFDKILAKQKIVCGRLSLAQKKSFFLDKAGSIESIACVPLGRDPCLGILAIASTDEDRFHADMGTDYLQFLSCIIANVLQPYLCE